jgi:type II secretory pathway pseudopilin PulG
MGTIKLMVRNLSSSSLTSLSSSSSSSIGASELAVSASAAAWKYKQMEVEIARAEANSSRIRKLALTIAAIASIAALLVVLVSSASKQQQRSSDDTGGGRLLRQLTISFRGGHYEANNNKDKKKSHRGNNNYAVVMDGVCKKDKDCSNPGECCSIHNYCGTGTEYCIKDDKESNKSSSKKKRKKQDNNDNNNESDNKSKQKIMKMEKKKEKKKNDNNNDKQEDNKSDRTKLKKMTKKQKKKEKKIKMRKSQFAANTSTNDKKKKQDLNDKKKKQDQEKVNGMDNNSSGGGGGGRVKTSFFSGCAQGRCCTPREVAQAVMMSSYEGGDLNDDGRSYCEAAVAVAFGESYDTPHCPGAIDSMASNMSNSDVRGVWQMSQGNGNGSVIDQAKKLWIKYVGNQNQELPEYDNAYCFNTGSWAIKTPIPGLPNGGTKWSFCTGAFTGTSHGGSDYYSKFIGQATDACAGL